MSEKTFCEILDTVIYDKYKSQLEKARSEILAILVQTSNQSIDATKDCANLLNEVIRMNNDHEQNYPKFRSMLEARQNHLLRLQEKINSKMVDKF
jgi:hypothetical protein